MHAPLLQAPIVAEYVPAVQLTHPCDGYDMYRPAPQVWHAADDDAPTETVYEPSEQSKQVLLLLAPVAAEYVPAEQLLHPDDPDGEYEPAPQVWQAADDGAATTGEYVPAMQLRQAALLDARDALEYVPAAQLVHSDPIEEE